MALADIRARIEAACRESGRPASSVTLVAASKGQSLDRIWDMLDHGQRLFGENKVQEAERRWPPLRAKYPGIKLHLIGHLQTNKAKEAVELFDVIETVDSIKLADALAKEMDRQKRHIPCFIQVNTGEEPQKGGVAPQALGALLVHCKELKLRVEGLMCIPPQGEIPDPHFALLHKIAAKEGLSKLSMGMSADFETAIRYGATHVRVGTALFGIRENIKAV